MTAAAPALAAVLDGRRTRRLAAAAEAAPFLATAPVAAAAGGYFPTAWGWSALALAWIAALAAIFQRTRRVTRLEAAAVSAFAALAVLAFASAAWSPAAGPAVDEGFRALVPLTGFAVAILLARRSAATLAGGVCLAIGVVGAYALATRLFPERLGTYDAIAGYRLAEPIGYWNALGLFEAMGALLALGLAARAARPAARAAAAAGVVVAVTTLYFTFSRGGWLALALGLVAALAADPRRLQLLVVALVTGGASAATVALAARAHGLTTENAPLAAASRDGHRIALVVLAAAAAAALVVLLVRALERRVALPPRVAAAISAALVVAALAAAGAAVTAHGGPVRVADRVASSFRSPLPGTRGHLNRRLFHVSGNGRAGLWATALDEAAAHPLTGGGAGSFEGWFLRHRHIDTKVRDAHSLYVETLAELGPLGLALVVAALGIPLLRVGRARRTPLGSALLAAYVAYLAHAAVDWDWETTGVTLAAVTCGAGLLAVARPDAIEPRWTVRARTAALVPLVAVMAAAFVGLVGSVALADGGRAARAGDWRAAIDDASRAHRWAPWSSTPVQRAGEAQLALGRTVDARRSFRRALGLAPSDWSIWFDLARATDGGARTRALAHATRLDPRSPELRELKLELRAEGEIGVAPR